ncbi:hypothetical protein MMC28_008695 [Mycoblastus sanguinarius]|nr:hypothetical protein [Mycoblastus sanguinarius]
MLLSKLSYLSAFLFLSFAFSLSIPYHKASSQELGQTAPKPISHDPESTALQRRVNEGASSSHSVFGTLSLPNGWIAYPFTESQALLPIEITAPILEEFYQAIFEQAARAFWGSDIYTPQTEFRLLYQQLQLVFLFSAGLPPIPWHIIAAFAFDMLQATKRGYTCAYTGRIQSPGGKLYLIVLNAGMEPAV